jgi:phospho-N-acetylmuramoyl-pentapeptide-transferase
MIIRPFFCKISKKSKEKRCELGLAGQNEKRVRQPWRLNYIHTRCLLCCLKLQNIYVVLLIVTTLWMGTIEAIKIFGQELGIIVGAVLYFSPAVTVRTDTEKGCFRVTTENVVTVSRRKIYSHHDTFL